MGICISLLGLSNIEEREPGPEEESLSRHDLTTETLSVNALDPDSLSHHDLVSVESEDIPIPSHSLNLSNHYTVNYPDHVKRTESAIYRKTHRDLCIVRNFPCFICGKTHAKDGISLETHHFYCEKAAQNAIDWTEFGKFAQNCYNIQTGENIGQAFDWTEVAKHPDIFVDSPYNMIVLCKEHHISGNKGIHHVPFPNWILQKYPANGFQFLL